MKTAISYLCTLLFLVCATGAFAELKTIGEGANMGVDITGYPDKLKAIYPNFVKKCIKCHGMDRTFVTLQTGVTPSGTPFDGPAIEAYGAKMLRKPDGDMSRQEIKDFVELMKYMADQAAK
jgi:hypothetical protein